MRDQKLDLLVIIIPLAAPPLAAPEMRNKKILRRRSAARASATGGRSTDKCDLRDPVSGRGHGIEVTPTVTTPREESVPDCLPCPTPLQHDKVPNPEQST